MPATTVSINSDRLTMIEKLSFDTDPIALAMKSPPSPAMPDDSVNTPSLSRTRLCPSIADAAGLSFIAARRRP